MNKINLTEIVIHGLMAFIGGIVKTITESQENVKKSFTTFAAGGIIGIFAGMVTYFICKHFAIDEYLAVTFTGLAGYMGAPLLDLFSAVTKRLILGLFGYNMLNEEIGKKKK
jgi:uncharacterized membrane protein HdeD (DUF308 family)